MASISFARHPLIYLEKKLCRYRYKHGKELNGVITKSLNGIRFDFDFSLGPNIKRMYYGMYAFKVKQAMKKYVKQCTTFLDIGANIGYLTAIGAGLVGKSGQVHSFEPVPQYFEYLAKLAESNPWYTIVANDFALGENPGTATISVSKPPMIGSSSIVSGFTDSKHEDAKIVVPVCRLDDYILNRNLKPISMVKIDVEGFELEVLKGAHRFFKDCLHQLPPIVVEIIPWVYDLRDVDICELEDLMLSYGYKAYSVLDNRKIDLQKIDRQTDVLFMRRR